MLRCAAPFVVAAYTKIRLTPQSLRALPLTILQRHQKILSVPKIYKLEDFFEKENHHYCFYDLVYRGRGIRLSGAEKE